MTKGAYTKPGRLSDVLALIQVLAFDPDTHRSESGIIEKELGSPASSKEGWVALAKEHPEIFRVSDEAKHPLSLVARHVQPSDQLRNDRPCQQSSHKPSSIQRLNCTTVRRTQRRAGGTSYRYLHHAF
jgi:hypothetical protein